MAPSASALAPHSGADEEASERARPTTARAALAPIENFGDEEIFDGLDDAGWQRLEDESIGASALLGLASAAQPVARCATVAPRYIVSPFCC